MKKPHLVQMQPSASAGTVPRPETGLPLSRQFPWPRSKDSGQWVPKPPVGFSLRMDNGSQFLSDHFQKQIKFWGMAPSFAFVSQPQANGIGRPSARNEDTNDGMKAQGKATGNSS